MCTYTPSPVHAAALLLPRRHGDYPPTPPRSSAPSHCGGGPHTAHGPCGGGPALYALRDLDDGAGAGALHDAAGGVHGREQRRRVEGVPRLPVPAQRRRRPPLPPPRASPIAPVSQARQFP